MKKNLDDILPSEFVERRTKEYELEELQKKKTTYWDFLGDLGFYLGFEAVQAVLNDYIEIEQARELLTGAKKAYYGTVYDQGVAALAGARGRYKGSEFDRLMKFYSKEM
jgi:hypothetical protein